MFLVHLVNSNPTDQKFGFEDCMKEVKGYPKVDKIGKYKNSTVLININMY